MVETSCGFESHHRHHKTDYPFRDDPFYFVVEGLEPFHANVQWTFARFRLDGIDTIMLRVPPPALPKQVALALTAQWHQPEHFWDKQAESHWRRKPYCCNPDGCRYWRWFQYHCVRAIPEYPSAQLRWHTASWRSCALTV